VLSEDNEGIGGRGPGRGDNQSEEVREQRQSACPHLRHGCFRWPTSWAAGGCLQSSTNSVSSRPNAKDRETH